MRRAHAAFVPLLLQRRFAAGITSQAPATSLPSVRGALALAYSGIDRSRMQHQIGRMSIAERLTLRADPVVRRLMPLRLL